MVVQSKNLSDLLVGRLLISTFCYKYHFSGDSDRTISVPGAKRKRREERTWPWNIQDDNTNRDVFFWLTDRSVKTWPWPAISNYFVAQRLWSSLQCPAAVLVPLTKGSPEDIPPRLFFQPPYNGNWIPPLPLWCSPALRSLNLQWWVWWANVWYGPLLDR